MELQLLACIDISNFTLPLQRDQLDYIYDWRIAVIIGLQDASKARAFKRQLLDHAALRGEEPVEIMYYVDRLGRDLSIPDDGAMVWIDIEAGCFTVLGDVNAEIAAQLAEDVQIGIYGNDTSIRPVLGNQPFLAKWPLWYANYGVNPLSGFPEFLGWTDWAIWQYASTGVAGINCDLNLIKREVDVIFKRSDDGHFIFLLDPNGFIVYRWGSTDGTSGSRVSRPVGDPENGGYWEWQRTRKGSKSAYWSKVEGD